jgi:hypothetical protein
VATVRAQAVNFGGQCVAELCVPGAIALQMEPVALEPHLELITQAGRELAAQGQVNPVTLAAVNRPPLSVDRYGQLAARYEAWCQKQHAKARKRGGSASYNIY